MKLYVLYFKMEVLHALLGQLDGFSGSTSSISDLQSLVGYGNPLISFTAADRDGKMRRLVAKIFCEENVSALANRLTTQAALWGYIPSCVPGYHTFNGGSAVARVDIDGKAGLAQVMEFVKADTLLSLIQKGVRSKTSDNLLPMSQTFGLALGKLNRELQSAKPAPLAGVRIVAGAKALAFSSSSSDDEDKAPTAAASTDGSDRSGPWDLRYFDQLEDDARHINDQETAGLVSTAFQLWRAEIAPAYAATERATASGSYSPDSFDNWRLGWVHGDANNHNVLVRSSDSGMCFIDWEDSAFSYVVHDPAISLTYLLLDVATAATAAATTEGQTSPSVWDAMSSLLTSESITAASSSDTSAAAARTALDACCCFLRAYTLPLPLKPSEVVALPSLIACRLATSLMHSAKAAAAATTEEQRAYVLVHAAPAKAALSMLLKSPGAREGMQRRFVAAAGLATTISRPPRSYVYAPVLSTEQRRSSALVAAALQWLGQQQQQQQQSNGSGLLMPVIRHDPSYGTSASSTDSAAVDAASSAGKTGWLPTDRHFDAPSGGNSSWWPRPPFIYDFSARNDALSSVVGTDRARLAKFTEMMFGPLVAPVGGEGSVEDSADAVDGALLPSPPALTPPPPGSGSNTSSASACGVYRLGWGQYGEDRVLYTSEHFTKNNKEEGEEVIDKASGDKEEAAEPAAPEQEPRTVHLGVDLEAAAGVPLHAPLAGTVHSTARNIHPLDYGPTVILQHSLRVQLQQQVGDSDDVSEETVTFYTLYGHLSLDSIVLPSGRPRLTPGQRVAAGDVIGWVGPEECNGGWPPHLHFQIDTELGHGGWQGDYPGVCAASDWSPAAYQRLCPDPNLLLRCPWVQPLGWTPPAAITSDVLEGHVLVSLPAGGAHQEQRCRVVGVGGVWLA